MEKDGLENLYQLLIHEIYEMKGLNHPSFNRESLLKLCNKIIESNHEIDDAYQNTYIQAIYNNNELLSLFNTALESSKVTYENNIGKLDENFINRNNELDEFLLSKKQEHMNKTQENEQQFLPKSFFLSQNKRANKTEYMNNIKHINEKRVEAHNKYEDEANDLTSINEQKQYQFNHSIEAAKEKNVKDKQLIETKLDSEIKYYNKTLENQIADLQKIIKNKELINADNTIISNDTITRLSDEYSKRLQYAFVPYEIEHNNLLDKKVEQAKLFESIEKQILVEFKNLLQKNDDEIELLRIEHKQFESDYKDELKTKSREQNIAYKKQINEYNKNINALTQAYNKEKTFKKWIEIKNLINQKKLFIRKQSRILQNNINEIKEKYLLRELEYIKQFEQLRTEKIKYESNKSNAMMNLNHEREYTFDLIADKINGIALDKEAYTSTDHYEETMQVLKLRLEKDIERLNIIKEINLLELEIDKRKYDNKYQTNKATYLKDENERLSNVDLMYQTNLNKYRIDYNNVSTLLTIQKKSIINKYAELIHNEKVIFEDKKMDFYNNCDNIQYDLYKNENDYLDNIENAKLQYHTSVIDQQKTFYTIVKGKELRILDLKKIHEENLARVSLYRNRFDVEKNTINDCYQSYISSLKNIIEIENYIFKNITHISVEEFNANRRHIFITLEYVKQIKLLLLEQYNEREIQIINSRINFEKGLKYGKILDELNQEKQKFNNQIKERRAKLNQTINSYKNTIKKFENDILNILNENQTILENIASIKHEKTRKFEVIEYKSKIKGNLAHIKNLHSLIKANKKNINELKPTEKRINSDVYIRERKYNKDYKKIVAAQEFETKSFKTIINVIKSQHYKLRSYINRSGYITTKNKNNYEFIVKNNDKILNINHQLIKESRNLFETQYLKLTEVIEGGYNLLLDNYNKRYSNSYSNINKMFATEEKINNTKLKNIKYYYNTTLKTTDKSYNQSKKELLNKLKKINEIQLEKQLKYFETINEIEKQMNYELKVQNENIVIYDQHYSSLNSNLKSTYKNKVSAIRKNRQNKIFNLDIEQKKHYKSFKQQQLSYEADLKSNVNILKQEYAASIKKIQNKIDEINKNSKKRKNKTDIEYKNNLKIFKTEQKHIRDTYNRQINEINKKCTNRIKQNQKEFIRNFKNSK